MAFLERRLVHADALRRLHLTALQPALHGALHDPVHLVPTQPHLKPHRRRGRLLQPIDHHRLERRREPRAAFAPRCGHLLDLVPLTVHPRHLGSQNRAVLAGIQMTPAPLTRVVAPRRLPALRAVQRLTVVLHVHDHLALLHVQLHVGNSPGRLDVQNPRVQVLVTHGSSVALLPQTPRPPAASSTRNPEDPLQERELEQREGTASIASPRIEHTHEIDGDALEALASSIKRVSGTDVITREIVLKSFEAPSWIRILAEAPWWLQAFGACAALYVAELVKGAAKATVAHSSSRTSLASSCPVIPVSGEASKEETLWGMYRAGGDQGSGRDKRGFDTPGMHFHSQLAAYSPLTEARKTH